MDHNTNPQHKIKLHAAPMEGLTGFAWRKAHSQVFGGVDKYYTPFVVANQTHKFKTKEIRDLTQNEENLIPQILTDKAEHFIWAAGELKDMGFDEINFNLGCPSATVTSRGKGSALLKDPATLDEMLDEIFSGVGKMNISIKTRIGFDHAELWPALLEVFRKYPLTCLIIHPRLRCQFYEGAADREVFKDTLSQTMNSTLALHLVYNGDICDPLDEAFGYGCDLMAGRGLLQNPALFRQAKGGDAASREELLEFHRLMLEYYSQYMSGDMPVIHHMKSMWIYLANLFECDEKVLKKLKKAKTLSDYKAAANQILNYFLPVPPK